MYRHIYQGNEYSSKELAKMGGISTKTFTQRVEQYGWSVEDAVEGKNTQISAKATKRKIKKRKYTTFATCSYRCNAK